VNRIEEIVEREVAAKLADDFAAFDGRAEESCSPTFYDRYKLWRSAFELASDGGAVKFR
jgi:hypothetical protein